MEIRKAVPSDLGEIMEIYSVAKEFMRNQNNTTQWQGGYPSAELVKADILNENLYVVTEGDELLAVFFFSIGEDETYKAIYDGKWIKDGPYAVIHRVAVRKSGRGIAGMIFDYCYDIFPNLRIDTHEDNLPMKRALLKNGFIICGRIYLKDGSPRIAFQKNIFK